MGFEFLADMAFGKNENTIDDVVYARKKYMSLGNAPLKTKAQILATGLGIDKNFDSLLKNGQSQNKTKGKPYIGAYPATLHKSQSCALLPTWKSLFSPSSAMLYQLPLRSCFFRFDLKLRTPFYSRDDLAHYITENPLKREWVFDTPYLSAAAVKGLLRWAWRIRWADQNKKDEEQIFGPRQCDLKDDNAKQGCLYTYPLFWKGQVALEVINPHDRRSGTGINPIKYEVVNKGGETSLFLMLVNRNEDIVRLFNHFDLLAGSLSILLEHSGLSAKKSAGWGDVAVNNCEAWISLSDDEVAEISGGYPDESESMQIIHVEWVKMSEFFETISKMISKLGGSKKSL